MTLQQHPPAFSPTVAYHEFGAGPTRDVYRITPDLFRQHLHALQDHSGGSLLQPCVTFDDAHVSQVEIAAPLLEEHGLRGIFFVPSAWVGLRGDTAGWPALRSLLAGGHRVGSHGSTHSLLTHCRSTQLARELEDSKACLEDHLGQPIHALSAPGGRWNKTVAEAAQAAGYRQLFTSRPGGVARALAQGQPLTIVPRLVVRRSMSVRTLSAYAQRDRLTHMRLDLEYGAKSLAKAVVGDALYQSLWSRLLRHPEPDVLRPSTSTSG